MNPAKENLIIFTDSELNILNLSESDGGDNFYLSHVEITGNLKEIFRMVKPDLGWEKLIEMGYGIAVRNNSPDDHESYSIKVFKMVKPMEENKMLVWSIQPFSHFQDVYGINKVSLEYEYFKKIFLGCVHEINNLLGTISGYSNLLKNSLQGHEEHFNMAETVEMDGYRAGEILKALSLLVQTAKTQRKKLSNGSLVQNMQLLLNKVLNRQLQKKFFSDENLYHPIMPPGNLYWLLIILSLELDKIVESRGLFSFSAQNIKNYDKNNPYAVRFRIGLALESLAHKNVRGLEKYSRMAGDPVNLNYPVQFSLVSAQLSQYGGRLKLETDSGQVVFVLDVPAAAVPKTTVAPDEVASLDGRGRTVLLVDDEESILLLLEQFLTHHNFHCLKAKDGKEAVDILNKQGLNLDLIILDYMMPEMDGEKVYDYILSLFPDIPVMFLTGLDNDSILERLRKKGIRSIIRKPFTGIQILGEIKRYLS